MLKRTEQITSRILGFVFRQTATDLELTFFKQNFYWYCVTCLSHMKKTMGLD